MLDPLFAALVSVGGEQTTDVIASALLCVSFLLALVASIVVTGMLRRYANRG